MMVLQKWHWLPPKPEDGEEIQTCNLARSLHVDCSLPEPTCLAGARSGCNGDLSSVAQVCLSPAAVQQLFSKSRAKSISEGPCPVFAPVF